MAQLVIAAAGAAVGGWGFTAAFSSIGAQVGWAIGSVIGASFGPTKRVEGARLTDLKVSGAEYGQPIAYVEGHPVIAGQWWWNSDRRELATTTSSGGKGGGGVETTTYTYEIDALIGLTINQMADVTRIFRDGKLIWTKRSDASAASITASNASEAWTRMTVYTGEADQLPDPTYETAVGAANAPAYRGRCYVFIEGLQLGSSGQIPNLTFEVCTRLVPEASPTAALLDSEATAALERCGQVAHTDADAGWLLHVGPQNAPGTIQVYRYTPGSGYALTTSFATLFSVGALGVQGNTDQSCMIYAGSAPNRAYMMTGASSAYVQFELSEAPNGSAFRFARKGNHIVFSSTNVVYRFGISGGSALATSEALEQLQELAIVGGEVFALASTGSAVYRLDLITLELLETISTPGSAGALNSIFSGPGTRNVWLATSTFVYERVGGAWVARGVPISNMWQHGSQSSTVAANSVYATNHFSSAFSSYRMTPMNTGTPDDEPLPDVVARLCARAGLRAGQYDVSGLSTITREVRGLALAQVAPTRQALELLASAYYFETTVSDKVYFRARGQAAVATITYEELGAGAEGDAVEALPLKLANDLEQPSQIALTYLNADTEGQADTQYSDRLVSAASGTVSAVQLPLYLTASEAKSIADAMLADQVIAGLSSSVALLGDYARLEPTDCVTLTDSAGATYRMRLVQASDAYPLLTYRAVLDDASILTQVGITSSDYTAQSTVDAPADTVLELLDIPILRDADNDAGFYAAAKGSTSPWPGAVLLSSADDVEYDAEETFTESGTLGECDGGGSPATLSALGTWAGPRIFDEQNSVTVDVGAGTLSSTTRSAMLLSQEVNAALVGSEIIQFRTATLQSTGVYVLTGLLRGARGTEWAMSGHVAGERFVLLQTTGLRRIEMDTTRLGVSRYYRGVTLGRALSTATAESFTNNGVGLKPFSPVDLRIVRESNGDITGTFKRRTRLADRFGGPLGDSVPLGEDSESYEIDIVAAGSPDTVLRTLSVTEQEFTYTAAQQTTDFGSPTPASVLYRIHQVSATVGRGYALEEAA
jgi:hypothetical protein